MEKRVNKDLNENITYLKELYDYSADLTIREMILFNDKKMAIITIEGMVNKDVLSISVINPIIKYCNNSDEEDVFGFIEKNVVSASEVSEIDTFDKVLKFIMSGFAVIAVDGSDKMLAVGVQGFSFRGISEPETDVSQRGSREGFVEPLRINMTLVRRRLKTPRLKFEQMTVGNTSKTDICLCYLSDTVDKKILKELKRRINSIKIDSVLAAGYLVEFLEGEGKLTLFKGVGFSERPDAVCGKIMEGRIAIIIDGTPTVLIAPYLFVENFQTMDDYSGQSYFVSLTRLMKYCAFIISGFLPGIFVAAAVYNPEVFPQQLLSLIAQSVASTPFPVMAEVLVIYFIYELMREAGLRLPRPLGHAVSIVGALVIGETAVSAGLIGPPTLMIVAITAISSYVIPVLYAPMAVIRLIFILIGGILGIWGLGIGIFVISVIICSKNSFGVPFSSPITPLSIRGLRDVLIRASWKVLNNNRFIIQKSKGTDLDFAESNDES